MGPAISRFAPSLAATTAGNLWYLQWGRRLQWLTSNMSPSLADISLLIRGDYAGLFFCYKSHTVLTILYTETFQLCPCLLLLSPSLTATTIGFGLSKWRLSLSLLPFGMSLLGGVLGLPTKIRMHQPMRNNRLLIPGTPMMIVLWVLLFCAFHRLFNARLKRRSQLL